MIDSAESEFSILPLRAVLRPAPQLAPEDSLARFVQVSRYHASVELPVQENGLLCGMVSQTDVLPLLKSGTAEEREAALQKACAGVMRPPKVIARPEMTTEAVGTLCAEQNATLVPVVDPDGYLLGIVLASDLLQPDLPTPRPSPVGGMATPFGVYLTNGSLQAGVGNLALVATGFLMCLLLVAAALIVSSGLWLAQRYAYLPNSPIFNLDGEPSSHQPGLALGSIALKLVAFVVFLLLMRATRLAGYHAAEHQTVHAIERNESLVPEIVARMPRPHPRCGTNFMAAFLLFFTLKDAFDIVPGVRELAEPFAALATVFAWRPVGTFLQERFTTKRANERQIASGIAAGSDLLAKYLHSRPERPRLWKRVWCMGLVQTFIGTALAMGLLWLLQNTGIFGKLIALI